MKNALWLAIVLSAVVSWGEEAPPAVAELAKTKIAALGEDPIIVAAVKAENAKGKSLDQIKEMDAKWMASPGVVDFMKPFMESDCAKRLKEFQSQNAWCSEIFVMDNQGANVAQTDKTSDYWQGDEKKFTDSFKNGEGAVFIDEVKFDDSTQSYSVQVSVPVIEGGKAIGAITVGVDIDQL